MSLTVKILALDRRFWACFWMLMLSCVPTPCCRRKRRSCVILLFWSCFSMVMCIIFDESNETRVLKHKSPKSKQHMLKMRSKEFWGSTFMDPGVICVSDQWKAVQYWYHSPASLITFSLCVVPLRSSQCPPVSLAWARPMAYQRQQTRWFSQMMKHKIFTTSMAEEPVEESMFRSPKRSKTSAMRAKRTRLSTRSARLTFIVRRILKLSSPPPFLPR
mmetsp:Transcript_40053/g.115465  ORF Transcript_40053/g.115465 Transcript_40053/m.115465 type:complete len:217 (-) Transcript_40053:994-1644(-)